MFFKSKNKNSRIKETQNRLVNGRKLPYLITEIEPYNEQEIHIFCSNIDNLTTLKKKLDFFTRVPDIPTFDFQYKLVNSYYQLTGNITQALEIFSNPEGFNFCSKVTADKVLSILRGEIPEKSYSETQSLI